MGGETTLVVRDFRFYVTLVCVAMLVKLTLEAYP